MNLELKEISNISMGYVFRQKIEYISDGNYSLLTGENFSGQEISLENGQYLKKVRVDNIKKENILKSNDILFKAKGFFHEAIYIKKIPENTITTSLFFVVRIKDKKVLPEYLCWYLNRTSVQSEFERLSGSVAGLSISNVSMKVFENIKIIIPSIQEQKKIIEINNLAKKEVALLLEIADKKKKLNENLLEELEKKVIEKRSL